MNRLFVFDILCFSPSYIRYSVCCNSAQHFGVSPLIIYFRDTFKKSA